MMVRCFQPTGVDSLRISPGICRIVVKHVSHLFQAISEIHDPWLAAERLSGMIPIKHFQTSVASSAPKLGAGPGHDMIGSVFRCI
jgi:hypothetical protein